MNTTQNTHENGTDTSSVPLSELCLEAAGRVDDGEQVAGLSELLRAVSLRLEKAGP